MSPSPLPNTPLTDVPRRRALLVGLASVALSGCSRREAAPPFDYTLLDGSRHRSEALRGQVVLMNFWATTCAVCVKEMPPFVATHRHFLGQGLQTLAVALRHDAPARVHDFATSRALPFGVVIDNTGAVAQAFGNVQVTPTWLLIDRGGRIAWRHEGEPDFERLHVRIRELLEATA